MRRKLLLACLCLPAAAASAIAQSAATMRAGVPCPPRVLPECPPLSGTPTTPTIPTTPTTPTSPSDPNQPAQPAIPGANDSVLNPFAQDIGRGGLASNTAAPNLFGDIVGVRPVRVGYTVPLRATFSIIGKTVSASGGPAVTVDPNGDRGSLSFGPTPNGTTRVINVPFSNSDLSYVQPTSADGVDFDRPFAQAALQTLLSNGQLTAEQVNQLNKLSAADKAKLLANRGTINKTITKATSGLGVVGATVSSVDGTIDREGTIQYTAILTGETTINLPGTGGVVGRVKMAEDNNPMPRDRLIFNYDYFDNVPLTPAGFNVSRFQFGFEKTFLDGRYSFEFRIPFAGTMNSTTTQGFETSNTEFGNLRFALKRIWLQKEKLTVSSGLGLALPTADDQVLMSALGGDLYRFKNESLQLEPFIGALYTPNDRLFGQAWSSLNLDVTGGDLTWDPSVFGGSGSARIWDLPVLTVDGQIGYWVIKPTPVRPFGLAPFVELHWNYIIAQNELTKQVGDRSNGLGLTISSIGSTELNMTTGIYSRMSDSLTIGMAASYPLLQAPDRTFNAQFGLRANYYFGAGSRMIGTPNMN